MIGTSRARGTSLLLALSLIGATFAAACGDSDSEPSGSGSSDIGACSIAFSSTFQGFRQWSSNHFTSATDVGASHVSGPRTEYWSEVPAAGATAFPVGMAIVKEIESTDPAQHHIFAMVKRGCDFNVDGAKDWEWFELSETNGAVAIIWRGVGPPAGEQYGGDANGGCNTCHGTACTSNDSVCSPTKALQLSH